MKVFLPDNTVVILNTCLSFSERITIFNNIMIDFCDALNDFWEEPKTKILLEVFANYLYPLPKTNRTVKEEISVRKQKELSNGSKIYSLFSDLSVERQKELGILDKYDSK